MSRKPTFLECLQSKWARAPKVVCAKCACLGTAVATRHYSPDHPHAQEYRCRCGHVGAYSVRETAEGVVVRTVA